MASPAFDLAFNGFGTNPGSVASGISSPMSAALGEWGSNPIQFDPAQINVGMPQIPGMTGGGNGFGLNFDTAKLALSGLGTIGNLWAAFQAQKLAKKQFNFTKDITERNLANQTKSYNTTLEDRARSRASVEDQSMSQQMDYINKNRL